MLGDFGMVFGEVASYIRHRIRGIRRRDIKTYGLRHTRMLYIWRLLPFCYFYRLVLNEGPQNSTKRPMAPG